MARVALVGPEIEENLSLRYLVSSLARAGHGADIVPFQDDADLATAVARVCAFEPEVVGLSIAFQWRAEQFFALAIALREAGYRGHVTAGGHFATFEANAILADFPEIDSICRQEAEDTLVRLTDAVVVGAPLGDILGLAFRDARGQVLLTGHPPLPDLATLPWPDRRGAPAVSFGHRVAPMVSSRGCYANCTFCCIAAWQEEALPGKRYRLRPVDDVADEMVHLQRTRGVDIFVFHDDNFFVPGKKANRARLDALADALVARGIGPFATIVKARPTDVDRDVFGVLKERLGCLRAYVGIETDADQGLRTLRRWAKKSQNHDAVEVLRALDLHACFNVLLFDPDTTLESLETNFAFMRWAADLPWNFGRVELYAGTPLLARMQAEGRARGDYASWDYTLASPEVEQVFRMAMDCYLPRNFGDGAAAVRVMGARFDVEVARRFHPELFRTEWRDEAVAMARDLGTSTVDGLEQIVAAVRRGVAHEERSLVEALSASARKVERRIEERARALESAIERALDQGRALGGREITPLQSPRAAHV